MYETCCHTPTNHDNFEIVCDQKDKLLQHLQKKSHFSASRRASDGCTTIIAVPSHFPYDVSTFCTAHDAASALGDDVRCNTDNLLFVNLSGQTFCKVEGGDHQQSGWRSRCPGSRVAQHPIAFRLTSAQSNAGIYSNERIPKQVHSLP